MPTLHIIEGPVGAEKTTYAIKLGRELGCPPLVLDAWMVNLFQKDRPNEDLWHWYAERKARCIFQIMELTRSSLDYGNDAIVELGLIKRADRLKLYAELETEGRDYLIHLHDAPRAERKKRVSDRNTAQGETFTMHVNDEVFEIASDMWEPVDRAEMQDRTDNFHSVK